METRIKICGITNAADAKVAVRAGADALGFIFYEKSPRAVTIKAAAEISEGIPGSLLRVGVFVNAAEEEVRQAMAECALTMLQFHGDETPDFCGQFGLMTMKAFRVRDADSVKAMADYRTDAWLLDAWSSATLGGSGETFNWDLAVEAKRFGRPIFLAGGLTPENVGEAIRKVRPFGVDVSSGVELAPGMKDAEKVRAFVTAARAGGR